MNTSCSGDYKAMVFERNGAVSVRILENDLFGNPKAAKFRKFCLYSMEIYGRNQNEIWKMDNRSGLCENFSEIKLDKIPEGYKISGTMPGFPCEQCIIRLSIGGGRATSNFF